MWKGRPTCQAVGNDIAPNRDQAHVLLIFSISYGFGRLSSPHTLHVNSHTLLINRALCLLHSTAQSKELTNLAIPPLFLFPSQKQSPPMAAHALYFAPTIFLLLIFNLHLHTTSADYGGWQGGHATFYGGGDASGTMGN